MRTPVLKTDRLVLREIHADDTNEIFNCWMSDSEVSKYMWWKASDDIKDAEEFVQFELEQLDNDKWFRWIIESKETNLIIGTCLIYWNDEDKEPHWDISYNLGRKYWGYGYTTEALKEAMEFARNVLSMKECITSYAKVNKASAKVLYKLGFIDEKVIEYECNGGDFITEGIMCRYSI